MDVVQKLWESLQAYFTKFIYQLPKIAVALIIILLFSFIAIRLTRFVRNRLRRRVRDSLLVDFIARLARWAMILTTIAFALEVAGFGGIASSLVAGAGITAFVIGFAFKDIGENFLAGIILAFKRPFEVGNVIQSKDIKGRVITIDLRTTHIKNAEGTDVYVPNSMIIKEPLYNHSSGGHDRYSTDMEVDASLSLKEIKVQIVSTLATLPGMDELKMPSITVEKVEGDKMTLRIFYWIDHYGFEGDVHLLKGEAVQRIASVLQSLKPKST